jgi:hypothetical protein
VYGVIISPRSDIEHHGELWLEVLANALEEPLMTIDFTVIVMLNGKDEIDSSTTQ